MRNEIVPCLIRYRDGKFFGLGLELSFELVVGVRDEPKPKMLRITLGLCGFMFQITTDLP